MLIVAVFVVLVAATPAMAAPASEPCTHTCSGTATISKPGTPNQQCVPDAGCGGGALLTSGAGPFVAVTATGVVALAAVVVRRRFTLRRVLATSRLLATRVFHPPQFSLSV
jgi:hypothetical protein